MRAWRLRLVETVFVASEATAWFMAIRLAATTMERGFIEDVTQRITGALRAGQVVDQGRAEEVLRLLDAQGVGVHGPGWLIVVATALAAFWMIRGVHAAGLDSGLGAAALLFGSILALNVLLHLALAGDLKVWDTSGLAGFIDQPDPYFAGRLDVDRFIASPQIGSTHGAALAMGFAGLCVVWLRFLVAGRRPVSFERVLRSFSIGFGSVLLLIVGARIGGVEGLTRYAVPHFVLGALALASANHARAAVPIEGERRVGPWAIAVGGTLAVLTGMALLLGLLAYLQVGVVLSAIGSVALRIIEVIVIITITPIFWVMDFVVRLFFPNGLSGMLTNLQDFQVIPDQTTQETAQDQGGNFPIWLANGLKFLAVLLILFLLYRLLRMILGARRRDLEEVEERRSATASRGGLGALLRDLLPRGGRRDGRAWMRAQPIYRLFGRTLDLAAEHGLPKLSGETPIEFGGAAQRMLGEPAEPVTEAFDRARYGRHYPADAELERMAAALSAWEREHPPSEEERERLAGMRPLDDADQIALRIEQAKRQARGDRDRSILDL